MLLGSDLDPNNEQHSLPDNRFSISKYTWPLLGDAFADRHVLIEMTGTTLEELFST
jgi:hypothetical protein